MEHNGLELATCCGVERLENAAATKFIRKKWSLIKNTVGLMGNNKRTLRLMHKIMYGNWEAFTKRRFDKFQLTVRGGFVGNTVLMKRSALEKIGFWDERINAADFDLYFRSKKRSLEVGDIKPIQIALGAFNHHFIKVTLKSAPPPFKDQSRLISLEEKWGIPAMQAYKRDLDLA
jgi:hypothetical protein